MAPAFDSDEPRILTLRVHAGLGCFTVEVVDRLLRRARPGDERNGEPAGNPGMQIFNPFDHQYWLQIAVAIICGGMIGIERELRGKPTGMRTCILIVLGTAIFVKLGAVLGNERGDSTRVLGQVVTGIGFLGAGVIMSRGDVIIGVTTASVVWVLAAIGALIGAGEFAGAVTMAAVTVVCLTVFDYLERWIQKHR